MKTRRIVGILGVVVSTLACSFAGGILATPTAADEVGTVVAMTLQGLSAVPSQSISTPAATQASGVPVSLENVSVLIPDALASSANTEKMTAVDTNSGAPWEIAPTHWRFTLTGYELQGKFHEPRIFVYPAPEFAQVNPAAAEQIERVQKILAGSALLKETLPVVPFFNAGPLIAASMKIIPFQNGRGVRALTQYAQYAAPINNRELFYLFEGLTSDNKYFVIAILPVTAPILAEDEKPESAVPAEGVPIPTDIGPNEVYYLSVTQKLNSLSPDSYTPSLNALDALIQSIQITNS